MNKASNNQRFNTECGRQRSKVKMLLLQCSALRKFYVTGEKRGTIRFQVMEGPNAHYQIAFCAFHAFLVEVQTNPDYIQVTHAQQQPGNEDCRLLLSPAINESNKLTA